MRHSRKQISFTIIELIMVIVIVGILAAISIPRFESFYMIKLDGATKKLVSDVRYVQQLAVSRHTDCKIVFSELNETYEAYYYDQASSSWRSAVDSFTRANLTVNFTTDAQYKGVDINSTDLLADTLRFDWRGVPQEGSDESVTDITVARLITFSYKGNNRNIYITPDTGRVRVQ